jgi:hypothetical protein
MIGYITDNELAIEDHMLLDYLTIDPSKEVNHYSYACAWYWITQMTGKQTITERDLTPELCDLFRGFIWDRYYNVVDGLLDKYDSNHLYAGTKYLKEAKESEWILRFSGKYLDIITINWYGAWEPQTEYICDFARYADAPFMVTEFYAKAEENEDGLANTSGGGFFVKTQQDRANYFENYTLLLLESKYCLGWVWYRFQDNDQSLYTNDDGKTILRVWERGSAYDIVSYIDQNGNIIKAKGTEVQIHKGETDTSNLGSNKGIVDNNMEFYDILCDSMTKVSKNIFNLISYFDTIH